MNAHTAVKQESGQVSSIRLMGEEKVTKDDQVSDKVKKPSSEPVADLTNGDPPQLMLWGSAE
jgi:hypothetical protein